jgi:predicted NBD/HSP70 family sugar kinase
LLHEGVLSEGPKDAPEGAGRPRTRLTLNPDAGQFVGVDFHADEILAVAVDFAQNIVKRARRPIRAGAAASRVVEGMMALIGEVMPNDSRRVLGIGIGCPGPVDREAGVALEYRHIRGLHGVPLAEPVARRFDIPTLVENTANAMALAELWFGQGRDVRHLTCLWIRSGVGAGIIVDRNLYGGWGDGAGEIGYWRCPVYEARANGVVRPLAKCGLRELEEIASVRAIRAALTASRTPAKRKGPKTGPRAWRIRDIAKAYREKDRFTRHVIDAAAGSLGWAVAQLALCLAPERVILSGPLAALGDDFRNTVSDVAAECFTSAGSRFPSVVLSSLGPFSAALGAAALVMDHWKPARQSAEGK